MLEKMRKKKTFIKDLFYSIYEVEEFFPVLESAK